MCGTATAKLADPKKIRITRQMKKLFQQIKKYLKKDTWTMTESKMSPKKSTKHNLTVKDLENLVKSREEFQKIMDQLSKELNKLDGHPSKAKFIERDDKGRWVLSDEKLCCGGGTCKCKNGKKKK